MTEAELRSLFLSDGENMLLSFNKTTHNIKYNELGFSGFCVGIISRGEFDLHHVELGIDHRDSTIFELNADSFRGSVIPVGEGLCFSLKVINIDSLDPSESRCCIYLTKQLVLVILTEDDNNVLRKVFYNAVNIFKAEDACVERFVGAFFNCLLENDGRKAEQTELNINELEEEIIKDTGSTNVNEQILIYNKKLMLLRNYYEQLVEINEQLCENEIFDIQRINYFKAVREKAARLCGEINLLRESLVRLREAYQARLDMKMNSTMKLFTVITAIFLPLTLITGWYGMNFVNMPELTSPHGYTAIIAVSISVVLICIFIFKKKKLL